MDTTEAMMTYLEEVTRRPTGNGWFTTNIIVLDHPAFFLRQFSEKGGTPVVIIPPQAGHDSTVADFDNEQSLVQTAVAAGRTVYAIDWKSCPPSRRNETIADLVDQVRAAVVGHTGPCELVGLCMGGWLAVVFASLYPHFVKKLIVAAAPIRATAGAGFVQSIVKLMPQEYYEGLVAMGGGVMRGELMLFGWKMSNPLDRFFLDYIRMWNAVGTPEWPRMQRFRRWYEHTMDIAGGWYLEAVDQIFRQDLIIKAKMQIRGRRVDPGLITAPIITVAGTKDDLTPVEQVHVLGGRWVTFPTGHIGTFTSRQVQGKWRELLLAQ